MIKQGSALIGFFLAVLACGVIIYALEFGRSLWQIIIAFGIFITPITFISSIKGKVAIFLFSSLLIMGGYICYVQHWYDTGYGLALAILLGGAVHVYRISKVETFSASDYKKEQKRVRSLRNGDIQFSEQKEEK